MPEPHKEELSYVIDGRSLLKRLPWQRGTTFDSIGQLYIYYVVKKYSNPTIVFDGYGSGPSTRTQLISFDLMVLSVQR